jgi:tight adherence protein B
MSEYFSSPEQLRALFMRVALIGIVAAFWLAALMFWYLHRSRRAQQLHSRLHLSGRPEQEQRVLRLWQDGRLAGETTVATDGDGSFLTRLERIREAAGWKTPITQILFVLATINVVLFLGAWLVLGNWMLGASLISITVIVFKGYLGHCVHKRAAIFEKQLIDSLDLSARSLRAGHPLTGAFQLIADEVPAPVGEVFREVVDQESMGVGLPEALRRAAERSHSADMLIFAASVIIQIRSGGNLAEMMERVAQVVRERMRLSRRARVLTAEAQLSKWVLLALPIGLFAFLNVANSTYMQPFYTHAVGRFMLIGAGAGMMVGGWVMGRMAVLKY